MKISIEFLPYSQEKQGPVLEMRAEQDDADKAICERKRAKFNHRRVYYNLENAEMPYQTHPDLIALACLLTYRPYINRELTLNFPVSAEFAWLVDKHHKISIGPISSKLVRPPIEKTYKNVQWPNIDMISKSFEYVDCPENVPYYCFSQWTDIFEYVGLPICPSSQ